MRQNEEKSLLTLTNASAGGQTIGQDNPFWHGVQLVVDITSIAGTSPSLTALIEGYDVASGKYYTLLTSAALTATGTTVLTVYPGVTATANVSAAQALPKTWRVRYTIGGTAPAVTATIGANLIR